MTGFEFLDHFHWMAVARSCDSDDPGLLTFEMAAELGSDAAPIFAKLVIQGRWVLDASGYRLKDRRLVEDFIEAEREVMLGMLECLLEGKHLRAPNLSCCERCAEDLPSIGARIADQVLKIQTEVSDTPFQ